MLSRNLLKIVIFMASQTDGGFSEEELKAILEAHHAYLLALLRFKTGSSELAEDLLQDTYLAFIRTAQPHRFQDSRKLRNFLTTIALNKVRDHFRRQKTRLGFLRTFSSTEELDRCIEGLASSQEGPQESFEREIERGVLTRLVNLTMEGLPDRQREILALKFGEGLDNPEIARRLDLGVKAVESLLFRAKSAFRKSFEKWAVGTNVYGSPDV